MPMDFILVLRFAMSHVALKESGRNAVVVSSPSSCILEVGFEQTRWEALHSAVQESHPLAGEASPTTPHSKDPKPSYHSFWGVASCVRKGSLELQEEAACEEDSESQSCRELLDLHDVLHEFPKFNTVPRQVLYTC